MGINANYHPAYTLDINGTLRTKGNARVEHTVTITGGTPGLNKILTSDANGLASWAAASGVSSLSAIGTTANANGATITGTVLNLEPASASFWGIVTTGAQTIAGAKTFSADAVVNGITVGCGTGNMASNTAVGLNALYSNTTGAANTANGYQSLYSNLNGEDNTANGYRSLQQHRRYLQ